MQRSAGSIRPDAGASRSDGPSCSRSASAARAQIEASASSTKLYLLPSSPLDSRPCAAGAARVERRGGYARARAARARAGSPNGSITVRVTFSRRAPAHGGGTAAGGLAEARARR